MFYKQTNTYATVGSASKVGVEETRVGAGFDRTHRLLPSLAAILLASAFASPTLAQDGSETGAARGEGQSAAPGGDEGSAPQNFIGENYLRFGTDERNITFAPFLQLDAGVSNIEPDGAIDKDNINDADLRFARLYVFATYDDISATLAYNFANEAFPWAYAFVDYAVTDRWTVRVGQMDEPFSLEDLTGGPFITFQETAQSAGLTPGDNVGAAVLFAGETTSAALGVYGGDVNTGVTDEGLALTGRVTHAPIDDEFRSVHLGLGASVRSGGDQPFGFSSDAGTFLIEPSLISTGSLEDVDYQTRGNLEFAAVNGRYSVQAELAGAYVAREQNPNAFFHGGYAFVSAFLTDDMRRYDASAGTFGRIEPNDSVAAGGIGAIELAGRLEYLDLDAESIDGGLQVTASAIANWYLTDRLRVSTNYQHVWIDDSSGDVDEVDALTFRLHYAY